MRIFGRPAANLVLTISLSILYGCTSNPFGENEISLTNRQIRGKVELSNNMSAEGVYVWLEGFDIGTRTDAEGNFQITLPVPASQSNPEGVTGAFNIYYFVANFNLTSTQVFTQNGLFVYSKGEINSNGELANPKFLIQNLQIKTKVQPRSITFSDIDPSQQNPTIIVRVDVTLQAIADTVIVFFPGLVNDTFGPLVFRNITTNEVLIRQSTIAGLVESDLDTIDQVPITRTMAMELGPTTVPPGEYEIIPYLLVKNEDIPTQLINSLGDDVEKLGSSYLNIPFRREGNERFLRVNK
jgi:hypothetical protein